jgi:thioredoxin-dependent peroxiredoxin
MAQTKLGDLIVNTSGELPAIGAEAPDFTLVTNDLNEMSLKDFSGKNVVLNIFPSVDTRVCAMSVREFNKRAASVDNTVVLCISKDLPYAFRRFCGAEGIDKVVTLSDYRDKGFSKNYGLEMLSGRMEGLHARAIVVIDANGKVKHTELVPVIGQEPNYDAALGSLS